MNEPMNPLPPGSEPGMPAVPASAGELYAELRFFLVIAVAAMLVLAVSIDLFLWYQFLIVRREVLGLRPQLEQMAADFEKNQIPLINSMYSNLVVFGKSNPEFNAILLRYNVLTAPPAATSPAPPGK